MTTKKEVAAADVHLLAVRGQGTFPLKLLSLERAYPMTMEDARNLDDTHEARGVVLVCRGDRAREGAVRRSAWEAEGWEVRYRGESLAEATFGASGRKAEW